MTTAPATLQSSRRRAIPLRARGDLVAQSQAHQGVGWVVVKDPVTLKYHRLHLEQHAVLELLDGGRGLEAIRDELRLRFPAVSISLIDIQQLIADLNQKGLLVGLRPGQAAHVLAERRDERRRKLRETFTNLLSLRLPGWDPDRTLRAIDPFVRWMFRPGGVAVAAVFVLAAWTLLLVRFDDFRRGLPEFREFFSGRNVLALWVTLAGAKVLHEFGHGLSCRRFGGECHEMGVMLLVFSPCLYCDVTDSWMLPDKRRRMIIAAAGMYVETILSALAIFVWHYTSPGPLRHLALNLFFVTTVTTIAFNANPLMRLDGYYILSDWLEVPNLRQRAGRMLHETFAWRCLGLDLPPDPFDTGRGRGWFIAYAVASTAYRWSVTLGVCAFLCVMLKPHGLQSLGVALAAASFVAAVVGLVLPVYRLVRAPRSESMSSRRIAVTLAAVAAALVLAAAVPIPRSAKAPFSIQPEGVRHLATALPGRLTQVLVAPGDRVRKGQLLAVLQSDELDDERDALRIQIAAAERSVERSLHQGEPARGHLAAERLRSLTARRDDLDRRREQLTLRSPCDGYVVAPPKREPAPAPSKDRDLAAWTGTPLDPANLGCFLDERTHVLSVAPTGRMDAVALVDQQDRDELKSGDAVQLRFDHLADGKGTVRSIAGRPLHTPHAGPAGPGKPAETTPRRPHSEEPAPAVAYQAAIALAAPPEHLKPGLRGEARFSLAPRSTAGWLWRWARRAWDIWP